jgi:uncharacterized membrane protein
MKHSFKTEFLPILVLAASVALGFYFYSVFPERVPTHWNAQGEVDGYGSRFVGAWLMPLVGICIYLLMLVLPALDPRRVNYEKFAGAYHLVKAALVLMLFAIYLIASFNALGYDLPVEVWAPLTIGVLFIVIGFAIRRVKPNWFIGIRTPWTMSSDEVWEKTHRLGGITFMIAGFIMAVLPLITPGSFPVVIGAVVVSALIPVIYSYFLFRRLSRNA